VSKLASVAQSVEDAPALSDWSIRAAGPADADAVTAAVRALLSELGASPPAEADMLEATRVLLSDRGYGIAFLAETRGSLVGLLTASWQVAIHIPGRYGLIQDLWVDAPYRSMAIGAALIEQLFQSSQEMGISRIEVGLPKESFEGLDSTASFYRSNGFAPLGTRMRRLI
jgi:GNAT superfamily N-acetyltransferase